MNSQDYFWSPIRSLLFLSARPFFARFPVTERLEQDNGFSRGSVYYSALSPNHDRSTTKTSKRDVRLANGPSPITYQTRRIHPLQRRMDANPFLRPTRNGMESLHPSISWVHFLSRIGMSIRKNGNPRSGTNDKFDHVILPSHKVKLGARTLEAKDIRPNTLLNP